MTIEQLRSSGHIIFECISGSRAYGLDTPSSDTDIRGVFILPENEFYSMNYIGQVNNETNDIVYYELRKFVALCANNNPNILELLNVPKECVLYRHPIFDQFEATTFLSKKCEASFANYAFTQIKKARGLKKKIVNPMEKERKSVLDFCFVHVEGKSIGLKELLREKNLQQENCGLSKVPHMKNCYNLYHNSDIPYKGVIKNEYANEVALSHIPKGEKPLVLLFFNLENYSSYCKQYKEYWQWVDNRNENRYANTMRHGKNYDAKNMMHTFRLLHMAKEIAEKGTINVKRSNREELLAIKEGKFEYDDLVKRAEKLKEELAHLFLASPLEELPNLNKINKLLVEVRQSFYQEIKQL